VLRLEGVVLSVIRHQPRTGKDGQSYDGYSQVQLQVEEMLENEQVRYGIHTLTTEVPDAFEKLSGKMVGIPVRVYVKGGAIAFTMPSTATPVAIAATPVRAAA
jgi:hypothetical protein